MTRSWLVLAAMLVSGAAASEPLMVRSGEHDGFSRLVISPEAGQDWRLGRTATGYALQVGTGEAAFDTRDVFRLIPRSRISGVETSNGRLQITLGCDCHATAFETPAGAVVIDVATGAPPDGSPHEEPLEAPVAGKAATAVLPPLADAAPDVPPDVQAPAWLPELTGANDIADGLRVSRARDHLIEQFSRAATQGLIDATQPLPTLRPRPQEAPAVPPSLAPQEPTRPMPDRVQDHLGIHAETSVDRDTILPELRPLSEPAGAACPDPALFAISDWADARPAATQFAERRAAVVGEFDIADPQAVQSLARLYLHFGFGAEARAVLRAFPPAPEDSDLLRDMAAILDEGHAPAGSRLGGFSGCDSAAALWAFLTHPQPRHMNEAARRAAILAFSALPSGLRHHLGPGLAERFLETGDETSARAVADAIARADATETGGMVDARLDLAQDRAAAAEARLETVVAENGADTPEALILLIDSQIARGAPVTPEIAGLAAALAYEHREGVLGPELARVQIEAAAAGGDFAQSFAALHDIMADGSSRAPGLVAAVVGPMVHAANDDDFLIHGFGEFDLISAADLPDPLREDLAERFLTLGFGPQAERVLGSVDSGRATVLRTKATRIGGNPQTAAQTLSGSQDAVLAEIGTNTHQAAPHTGATGSGEGGTHNGPPADPPPGPLAQSRALLEQSRAGRATLDTLLRDHPAPVVGAP